MNVGAKRELSSRERTWQRRLRGMGAVILIAGALAAVVVYLRAAPDDEARYLFDSGTQLSGNARRYANEMKSIGGESNVMAAELRDWFDSLWRGRRLAGTLTLLSLGGSLACFLLAHLLNYPPPPEDPASGTAPPGRDRGRQNDNSSV